MLNRVLFIFLLFILYPMTGANVLANDAQYDVQQCEKGDHFACDRAARHYFYAGERETSHKYAKLACQRYSSDGCEFYLNFLIEGNVAERMQANCQNGSAHACSMQIEQIKYQYKKDNNVFNKKMKELCEHGNGHACFIYTGTLKESEKHKFIDSVYQKCKQGEKQSCLAVVDLKPGDAELLLNACAHGHEQACFSLLETVRSSKPDDVEKFCLNGMFRACQYFLNTLPKEKHSEFIDKACKANSYSCGFFVYYYFKKKQPKKIPDMARKACQPGQVVNCYYKQATQTDSFKNPEYRQALYRACEFLKQSRERITCRHYNQVLSCDRGEADHCSEVAEHFAKFGNPKAAEDAYQHACSIAKERDFACYYYGRYYFDQKQPDKAMPVLQKHCNKKSGTASMMSCDLLREIQVEPTQ